MVRVDNPERTKEYQIGRLAKKAFTKGLIGGPKSGPKKR
jgi:hypothetical protein